MIIYSFPYCIIVYRFVLVVNNCSKMNAYVQEVYISQTELYKIKSKTLILLHLN